MDAVAGSRAMSFYRLYHIKGAYFSRFDEIEAADDAQAIDKAELFRGAGHAELWRDGHKIKRLSPARAGTSG